jgi:isopentenyl-diphosphate Delta-isomerase
MVDELIDIVDEESGERTGNSIMKNKAHAEGLWHEAIHIWIINSKGQVLLQKRAKRKKLLPGVWDVAVGGHVGFGEKIIESALRELKEEIGVNANKEDLEKIMVYKNSAKVNDGMINNEFYHIFLLKKDLDINNLELQEEEVEKVKWFSFEELKELLKPGAKDSILSLHNYIPKMISLIEKKK